MIQLFRNFFASKLGIVVTLAFLGVIALAFASMDVANTGSFGGVAGGDRVAVVGDERIDINDLSVNASNGFDRVRQENPTMTMQSFIANGGLQQTLDTMIDRTAIAELARMAGIRAGTRLVDSEIVNAPEFRGIDGSFDQEAFRAALSQRGLSEDLVRTDLANGLLARQLVVPLAASTRVPDAVARRYTQLRRETRKGSIAGILAAAYAPDEDPTNAQVQAYYDANRSDYIRPERRTIRYAIFDAGVVGEEATPTAAQVKARYDRDAAQYAALETRGLTQVIVPTQAAAQALVNEVKAGTRLEQAAQSKGLSATALSPQSRQQLTSSASAAVANAAFSAPQGGLSAPAQGGLGWYVMRVDNVDSRAARSLEQARAEIVETLTREMRVAAINDLSARVEDDLNSGRSLSEVAQEIGVELQTSRPVTAAGQVYGTEETAPAELARVLPVVFEMDQAEPQLAALVPGETFIIYEASQITRAATAPLKEIRDRVVLAWRVDEGMKAAGAAATRVMKRVAGGQSLAAAVAAEDVRLPPPQQVSLSRAEVEQSGRLTPSLALFFSMAEGTTKRLENREALGWIVIDLDEIDAPEIAANDPEIANTARQLQSLLGDEYAEQFIEAAKSSLEIDINQNAVDAVADQLTGTAN